MTVSKITPATKWVKNEFSPLADYLFKSGNKPPQIIGARLDFFENYNNMDDVPDMDGPTQKLWSHYPNGDNARVRYDAGTLSIDDTFSVAGSKSIKFTATSDPEETKGVNFEEGVDTVVPSTPYLQFYTHDENRWQYVHEVVQGLLGQEWKFNYYNRIALYVKMPSNTEMGAADGANFSVGTFYSSIVNGPPTSNNAEVGGGNHGYHRYNLAEDAVSKIVVDCNPTHIRGADGNTEQPLMEYPIEADSGKYNYFDLLTRLYFSASGATEHGLEWNYDNFYFYRENRIEEEVEVYSLAASYQPTTSTTSLSFNVHKNRDEETAFYEVRYSDEDIHDIGFENASEWVTTGDQGYQGDNIVAISTQSIDASSMSTLFIAVRKVGHTLFKQISLEV